MTQSQVTSASIDSNSGLSRTNISPHDEERIPSRPLARMAAAAGGLLTFASIFRIWTLWQKGRSHTSICDGILVILTAGVLVMAFLLDQRPQSESLVEDDSPHHTNGPGDQESWESRLAPLLICLYILAWPCFKVATGRQLAIQDSVFIIAGCSPLLIQGFYLLRMSKTIRARPNEEGHLKEKTKSPDRSQKPLSSRTRSSQHPAVTTAARIGSLVLAIFLGLIACISPEGLTLPLYFGIGAFTIISLLGGIKVTATAGSALDSDKSQEKRLYGFRPVFLEMLAIGTVVGLCKRWLVDPDTLEEWGPALPSLFAGGIMIYSQARVPFESLSLGLILTASLAGWLIQNPDSVVQWF